MDTKKGIKPIYLYLLSGISGGVAFYYKNDRQTFFYTFLAIALIFLIWALINYFRD